MSSMFEKITLRIFFVCLVGCASLVLFTIWSGKSDAQVEVQMKTAVTFFVVGLASFLSWFVSSVYHLRRSLVKK